MKTTSQWIDLYTGKPRWQHIVPRIVLAVVMGVLFSVVLIGLIFPSLPWYLHIGVGFVWGIFLYIGEQGAAIRTYLFPTVMHAVGFSTARTGFDHSRFLFLGNERISMTGSYVRANTPYTLHTIEIIRSHTNKRTIRYPFLLLAFHMQKEHPTVTVCDTHHAVQPNREWKCRLEGVEFHQHFQVYAQDPKAPFHFFDPDTMADLIDIRSQSSLPFCIDVSGTQIAILIDMRTVHANVESRFTLQEKFFGRIRKEHLRTYEQSFTDVCTHAERIFHSLDYQHEHSKEPALTKHYSVVNDHS